MSYPDIIVPAQSPEISAHTYTSIYGGASGCNIKVNGRDIVIPDGKTIFGVVNEVSSGNGCFLLGNLKDNPIYSEGGGSLPYSIAFRFVSTSTYRTTYTVSPVDGFNRYYQRYMTITPTLLVSNPIAPASVSVYSYDNDLELVTSFNNGVGSSNRVANFVSNQTNFDFYYGARLTNNVVVVPTGALLRVRVLDNENNIIAETNFLETSNNITAPTIVDAP